MVCMWFGKKYISLNYTQEENFGTLQYIWCDFTIDAQEMMATLVLMTNNNNNIDVDNYDYSVMIKIKLM